PFPFLPIRQNRPLAIIAAAFLIPAGQSGDVPVPVKQLLSKSISRGATIRLVLIPLLVLFCLSAPGSAKTQTQERTLRQDQISEHISSFLAQINVNPDCTLDIYDT